MKETIKEIGMSIENVRIECPAKPITHAFIYFKNDDEMNKYVRSANMLKRELKGRKIKMTRSMDAEERFHQKRMGYVRYCIHTRHNISLHSTSLNWNSKYVSVKGKIVVKTCQCGSLKYFKNQDIELEVEDQMENGNKKLIATTASSREKGQRRRNEGKTTSSRIHLTTQGNQGKDRHTSEGGGRQKLKQVDGDIPACMRRDNDNKENKMRRNDNLKGKGGGRLKHCNVDGDVPLCLRSFDEENKGRSSSKKDDDKERMTSGSSVLNSMMSDNRSKMTSGKKLTKTKKVKKQKVRTPHSLYYKRT